MRPCRSPWYAPQTNGMQHPARQSVHRLTVVSPLKLSTRWS